MEISTVYPFEKDIPDMRDLGSTRPFSTYNSRDSRLRPVNAIVAMGRDRSIGINGDVPWHIREDLRHFKALTSGHPVIMGRATWESLPKRPLPGRLNIVVTRNPDYVAEGAQTAPSIEAALQLCPVGDVPFIIGGGQHLCPGHAACVAHVHHPSGRRFSRGRHFLPRSRPAAVDLGVRRWPASRRFRARLLIP